MLANEYIFFSNSASKVAWPEWKIYFSQHMYQSKQTTEANHQYHIHEASGLWCRYLCTLSAFLVEQHFLQISQMVPMSKCLDSMCWMTLCLILLINPHSRQSQSPVRDLCIFRPTRHSRTRSWLKPLSPKTRQSKLYFWKSVSSWFVNKQGISGWTDFFTTRALVARTLGVLSLMMILHPLFVVAAGVST